MLNFQHKFKDGIILIYSALSIVAPSGVKIMNGLKTLEIRSWHPPTLPLKDLVIVENNNFLNKDFFFFFGLAIALVDIESIHEWQEDEIEIACASYWETGYYAWVITNIRPLHKPIKTIAKRKIYTINLSLEYHSE